MSWSELFLSTPFVNWSDVDNISASNPSVKEYLKNECQNLLENPNITEGIETALPYGSGEESGDILGMLIREIAEIE